MSYSRNVGRFICDHVSDNQKTEELLCQKLQISHHELEKIYDGRIFLTGADFRIIADVLDIKLSDIANLSENHYSDDLERVLDLIDAYIDIKESLV